MFRNKRVEEVLSMNLNTDAFSSTRLMEEVKDRIKDLGKTQEEFGKEVGYSRKALNRIVTGESNVSFSTVVMLCKKLGIKAIIIE